MNKKFLFRSLILFLLTFYVNVLSAFANSSERCVAPKEIELQIKDWPTAPIGGYTLDGTSKLPDLIAYFFGWGVGLGGMDMVLFAESEAGKGTGWSECKAWLDRNKAGGNGSGS